MARRVLKRQREGRGLKVLAAQALFAFALLGLIWVAYTSGLIDTGTRWLMSLLIPDRD